MHMMFKLVIRLCLNKTVPRQQSVSMEGYSSLLRDEDTSSWWQHSLSVVIGKRNSCSIPTGTEGYIVALDSERAEMILESDDLP